jgi:hypothetical protein
MPVAVPWSLGGPLVFVEEAAKDGSALDSFLGEIGYGVVGPRRLELEGAVRVPCHNSNAGPELVFSVLVRLLSGTR